LLIAVFAAAVCFSPIMVGACNLFPAAAVAVLLSLLVTYALAPARGRRCKRIALVILSLCSAVTLADVAARPLLSYFFEVRASERFIRRYERLPQLQRYLAGVNFEGTTYGDLAAVSGRKDWREPRQIKFVTDQFGFRNEPPAAGVEAGPLDLIVLGDSFGTAGGTSQEELLSTRFARDYGLSVYNLSIARENPQQEFANLQLEGKRLQIGAGTCVLWLIFPGNDLDEPYYPDLENPRPVSPVSLARLVNSFRDFRSQSAVRRIWPQVGSPDLVVERKFIDGQEMLFFAPYVQRKDRLAADVVRHPNFERLKATLAAMEKLAAEARLTVAVVLVPSKEEVYSWVLEGSEPWSSRREPSGFATVLRELSDEHGFRFLDLKPGLVDSSRQAYEKSGTLLWWRDDTHWNGAGQRAAAAAIYQELLRGH
jgi:hypothetical protein